MWTLLNAARRAGRSAAAETSLNYLCDGAPQNLGLSPRRILIRPCMSWRCAAYLKDQFRHMQLARISKTTDFPDSDHIDFTHQRASQLTAPLVTHDWWPRNGSLLTTDIVVMADSCVAYRMVQIPVVFVPFDRPIPVTLSDFEGHFCHDWQNASRGPSASAELLVNFWQNIIC